MAAPLTDEYVLKIARRIVGMFRNRLPADVSHDDALGDATVHILTLAPQYEERMRKTGRHRSDWPGFEAWLVKRAWGDLSDQYAREWRRNAAVPTYQLGHAESPIEPKELAVGPGEDAAGLALDVQEAIDALPEAEGYVVRCAMQGMTQAEIGECLGYSQPYVSAMLIKARKALAVALKDYAPEEAAS